MYDFQSLFAAYTLNKKEGIYIFTQEMHAILFIRLDYMVTFALTPEHYITVII